MRLNKAGTILVAILFLSIFPIESSYEFSDNITAYSQKLIACRDTLAWKNYLQFIHSAIENPPESSWKTVWTYSLENVSDIAASEHGIAMGSKNGLVVLDLEGNVLWEREGDISSVDMKGDVIAALYDGAIELYTVLGNKLASYSKGTAQSVSLSKYGIMAVGSSHGVILLDTNGTILQEYNTGAVGAVSISPDGAVVAYRKGGTVYVLDILGEIKYIFEDGGSIHNQIIVTSSGWVFTYAGGEVFLHNGKEVVWSAKIEGCEARLAVSTDETIFAVNADKVALYTADGEFLSILHEGNCGSIAFSGNDIVVSDADTVYYLEMEKVPIQEDSEEKVPFPSSTFTVPSHFSLVLVVLVAMAMVVIGIIIQKKRKRQEGKYLQILEELKSQDTTESIEEKPEFEYDIAISFAGEDRKIAEDLASALQTKGVQVFYDEFYKHELWGKKLTTYFQNVYGPKTRFVVPLISHHYPVKDWTDFEFSIMRKEAKIRQAEFILPVKLDDTKMLGIHEDIGYLDYRKEGIDGIVDCLVKKLR